MTGTKYGIEIAGGAGTVLNSGSITTGTTNGTGIYLKSTGLVHNYVSGVIDGQTGVNIAGISSTLINAGKIGTTATPAGVGVTMQAGGYVNNAGGGSITGSADGVVIGGSLPGIIEPQLPEPIEVPVATRDPDVAPVALDHRVLPIPPQVRHARRQSAVRVPPVPAEVLDAPVRLLAEQTDTDVHCFIAAGGSPPARVARPAT